MIRLFEQHQIRKVTELDGMWDFTMDGFPGSYRLPVPDCFEQHPDFLSHRGTGVYTRTVFAEKDGNLRLEFKGVSHTADVYLDGEKIARHYNAFTPFSATVKNVKRGAHTLKVAVDNSFGEASALHVPNDYYTYGGITRPVALEEVSDVYCESLHVTTRREASDPGPRPTFSAKIWRSTWRTPTSPESLSGSSRTAASQRKSGLPRGPAVITTRVWWTNTDVRR